MTSTEAYSYIDGKLDKTGTGVFENADKQLFINDAIEEFLVEKRKLLGNDLINDSMVQELIQRATLTEVGTEEFLSYGAIDATWKWVLEGYAGNTPLYPRTAAEMYAQGSDPFNQNLFIGDQIYWKTSWGTSVKLVVLVEPTIDYGGVNPFVNLSNQAQREILNRAVRMMMLAVEDPRYQGADKEEQE